MCSVQFLAKIKKVRDIVEFLDDEERLRNSSSSLNPVIVVVVVVVAEISTFFAEMAEIVIRDCQNSH